MAIKPSDLYPGQVQTNANWPQGRPRNALVEGDGSGTPFEETWLADLWGWQQALLLRAGLTPTGNPDSTAASQYLEAMRTIFGADLTEMGVGANVSSVTVSKSLGVSVDCSIGRDANVARDLQVTRNIHVLGSLYGESRARRAVTRRTDLTQTIPRNQYHVGAFLSGDPSIWTIDATDVQHGDWVACALGTATAAITVRSGVTLATLSPSGPKYMEAIYATGEWTVLFTA